MKEETQNTAYERRNTEHCYSSFSPTDCGTNTRANGRADRKVLCRKHYQKPQARSTEVSRVAPGATDHRRTGSLNISHTCSTWVKHPEQLVSLCPR